MPVRALTAAATLAVAAAAWLAPAAAAAGPPSVDDTWAANVSAGAADLKGTVNPNGLATLARVQYVSAARYEANIAASLDPFAGGTYSPLSGVSLGAGTDPASFTRPIAGLEAATAYRYRIVASNSAGPVEGPVKSFATTPRGDGSFALPDSRGWEMVSPIDKNGGEIQNPGEVLGGGAFQAAAAGDAVTYSSTASFGAAAGAPGASQYLSRRGADGWLTANITRPSYGGGYGAHPDGVPFQLFDPSLDRALFALPWACGAEPCPRAYSRIELAGGALGSSPSLADLRVVGASEDLATVLLSTCAKLTADATEATLPGGGCDPAEPNLYAWSAAGLALVNLLPAAATGTPGATVAAPGAGAVSADGASIYFTVAGNLYLRRGGQSFQLDAALGGGATFQAASADGAIAYFTKAGHLYRYAAGAATDLTPAGGVSGVLGASPSGAHAYYATAAGVFHAVGAGTAKIADQAAASDYPPASATARVAEDGTLAFLSAQAWPGSDNGGYPQAFLYTPADGRLACVSCNPTGVRSQGAAAIAAATGNGSGPSASSSYRPRALAAAGRRLFFASPDPLVLGDTNNAPDVYEWEAQGEGSCAAAGGCVALLSSGRAEGGARFIDASADGADVYFLTPRSLVEADPGGGDVYVARVGGGFPVPSPPIPCTGDSCQPLPEPPGRPTLATTTLRGEANPPLHLKREWVPKRHKKKCPKPAAAKKKGKKAKAKKAGRARAAARKKALCAGKKKAKRGAKAKHARAKKGARR